VFFSDIVGFTDISSQLDAAQVNAMLDRLFQPRTCARRLQDRNHWRLLHRRHHSGGSG